MTRRSFLQAAASVAVAGSAVLLSGESAASPSQVPPKRKEPNRGDPLDPAMVKAFVSAGHRDLPKVKELLGLYPLVLNATVDLGKGDWESALGAASHTGNKAIARFLLEAGARPDIFCAAMLGARDAVKATLDFTPQAANARGPHGLTLLYHAGYTGDVCLAETLSPHLMDRARHCNQALLSACPAGHTEFVTWLLQNGADNPNLKAFGKTPLDLAVERGFEEIARVLSRHGAVRGAEPATGVPLQLIYE